MIKTLPPLTLDTLADHMVEVPGGTFEMGGETDYDDSKPIHSVQLDTFYLCRYPVTQVLCEAVMGSNPAAFLHPQRPVECISWYDAVIFCNRLSEQQSLIPAYHIDRETPDPHNQSDIDDVRWTVSYIRGANGYRLPNEAEWEYAARGGPYAQPHAYVGSPNPSEVAHWKRNSHAFSQPVGLKPPNALGLYDLSGNVREWIWDWYAADYYQTCAEQGTMQNPTGPPQGSRRGARGGSWNEDNVYTLQVEFRDQHHPNAINLTFGLRLCRYPRR